MSNIIKMHENKYVSKTDTNQPFSRFDDKRIKKVDQICEIADLMRDSEQAIRLQIDNLVLTYGIQAVRKAVKTTDLKTIQKCKKVA